MSRSNSEGSLGNSGLVVFWIGVNLTQQSYCRIIVNSIAAIALYIRGIIIGDRLIVIVLLLVRHRKQYRFYVIFCRKVSISKITRTKNSIFWFKT